MRRSRSLTAIAIVCISTMVSCARAGGPVAGPIEIDAMSATPATMAGVRVRGLSASELRALADARYDDATWASVVRVSVSGNDTAPVAGRYAVTEQAIEFRPRFPFDQGREYTVRVDPGRLPVPRREAPVTMPVRFGVAADIAATAVTAIYPSADVWPENMLRFYVHFSAPMARGQGVKYVHLLDELNHEIPDAILAAYADLWDPAATRLTVFFDPGRVKRGVGPNMALGRAIVAGRRYAIAIDAAWPDAHGRPLTAPFRRAFTAGSAAYRGLDTAGWRIDAPRPGGRDPLRVTFPSTLDHALLERAIGVRSADGLEVAGHLTIGPAERSWAFVPIEPWTTGPYHLVVLAALEDPAGNKIGRAFEVLPADGPEPAQVDHPEIVHVPFVIK